MDILARSLILLALLMLIVAPSVAVSAGDGRCPGGELEAEQQALEEGDAREQALETPDPSLIDGPETNPTEYDNEEPDARQRDLERPRYEYDF